MLNIDVRTIYKYKSLKCVHDEFRAVGLLKKLTKLAPCH